VNVPSRAAALFTARLVAATVALGVFARFAPGIVAESDKPADKSAPASQQATSIEVRARAIDRFDRANPDRQQFGRLRFRGGLVLTSLAKEFGGYSALALAPDGRRFVALSDEGTWLVGDIAYDGARPKGIVNTRVGPLVGLKGRALNSKRDLDAESLALLEGTLGQGTVLIGFERNHRIGRFPIGPQGIGPPTGYLKLPPEARRMRSNSGLEAVAVLHGDPHRGAVVAFAEQLLDERRNHTGWLWHQGEPQRLSLVNIRDFDITDAAALPDGDLVVLERFFRMTEGVKMRLRLIKAADLRPGAPLDGEVLLEADGGYEIDNMEGLAVHQDSRGETVLTLISDNNFNSLLQRTLLLQFTLLADGRTTVEGAR
jgi:hypothetical protein